MPGGPAILLVLLAAMAAWLTAIAPTGAEPPAVSNGMWRPLPGPPPADSGKAAIPAPDASGARDEHLACIPGLPCGTRLLGTVRKNGAVELQLPALRW
jgi:hypothetical protein